MNKGTTVRKLLLVGLLLLSGGVHANECHKVLYESLTGFFESMSIMITLNLKGKLPEERRYEGVMRETGYYIDYLYNDPAALIRSNSSLGKETLRDFVKGEVTHMYLRKMINPYDRDIITDDLSIQRLAWMYYNLGCKK